MECPFNIGDVIETSDFFLTRNGQDLTKKRPRFLVLSKGRVCRNENGYDERDGYRVDVWGDFQLVTNYKSIEELL